MDLKGLQEISAQLPPYVYLATIGADGTPDVTPVIPAWEGDTLWVLALTSSKKARNIAANPEVALHWQINEQGDGIELWGTAVIDADVEAKRSRWKGLFSYNLDEFLPGGPESDLSVLIGITPKRGVFIKQFGAGGTEQWRP